MCDIIYKNKYLLSYLCLRKSILSFHLHETKKGFLYIFNFERAPFSNWTNIWALTVCWTLFQVWGTHQWTKQEKNNPVSSQELTFQGERQIINKHISNIYYMSRFPRIYLLSQGIPWQLCQLEEAQCCQKKIKHLRFLIRNKNITQSRSTILQATNAPCHLKSCC